MTLPETEFRAPRRAFQAPPGVAPAVAAPSPADLVEAPAAQLALPGAEASLAIVSLNPSRLPEPPTPPGSHDAGFSAGPKPREGAAAAPADGSAIVVPGLTTRDGASDRQPSLVAGVVPTTRNLMAGLRNPQPATTPDPPSSSRAARVSSAPDPLLAGRVVYSIAIQMPNITSYSGSWMVWFCGARGLFQHSCRGSPRPGPSPQGGSEVRGGCRGRACRRYRAARRPSFARTGMWMPWPLLRRLDERLDRSAQEALGKWQFEPALRDGAPVDVDAIFEIPFRLRPKPGK